MFGYFKARETLAPAKNEKKHAHAKFDNEKFSTAELAALQRKFVFDMPQEFEHVSRAEIIGLDYIFEELDTVIWMLQNFSKFTDDDNLDIDSGMMLKGPPGVGKTFCAQYLATIAGARFLNVAEFPRFTSDGLSAEDVATLFILARSFVEERKQPIVLFWDEFDAFVSGDSEKRVAAVAQLNACLSGSRGKARGVFLVATTNKPHQIPGDLLRDGRIGVSVSIGYPNTEAKKHLLKYFLSKKRLVEGVDIDSLVYMLPGGSTPIMIKNAVERAWQRAKVRSLSEGSEHLLTEDDLVRVLLRKLRGAPEDVTLSQADFMWHARNAVGQALVARTLGVPVQLIALSESGYKKPHVISEWEKNRSIEDLRTKEDLIAISLATIAVEELFHYPPSNMKTAAREQATSLATELVEEHRVFIAPDKGTSAHVVGRGDLVSLPTVTEWRSKLGIATMAGVHDDHWSDYTAIKELLELHYGRAQEIILAYGQETIDSLVARLWGSKKRGYLTQRDIDEVIKPSLRNDFTRAVSPVRPAGF